MTEGICQICKSSFTLKKSNQKFCSPKCRKEGWKRYINIYVSNYYYSHPEYRERSIQFSRKRRENNKPLFREYSSKWRKDHKIIEKAHKIASKIPLGECCELCPDDDKHITKLERHHPDYNYPSIFITCCGECHEAIHSKVLNNIM